jgi:predicted RecA/RadA family phage recombinase
VTAEATLYLDADEVRFVAGDDLASGEVLQMPDGRAGWIANLRGVAEGDQAAAQVEGQVELQKTASINILAGGKVYWDTSAGKATFKAADGDFYVGRAVADSLAAATTVLVQLNVDPPAFIDLRTSTFDNVLVNSATYTPQAAGLVNLTLASSNEAEKTDLLSVLAVPVTRPCIMEFRAAVTAAAAATDINIGLASATHASDADSIAESVFFHIDGASLNILAESDDGTTEVAATDTTVDFAAATMFEGWIDARDLTDIQLYINGVNVLPATVFKLDAATGPLKALVHMEKTSSTDTGIVRIEMLRVRTMDV